MIWPKLLLHKGMKWHQVLFDIFIHFVIIRKHNVCRKVRATKKASIKKCFWVTFPSLSNGIELTWCYINGKLWLELFFLSYEFSFFFFPSFTGKTKWLLEHWLLQCPVMLFTFFRLQLCCLRSLELRCLRMRAWLSSAIRIAAIILPTRAASSGSAILIKTSWHTRRRTSNEFWFEDAGWALHPVASKSAANVATSADTWAWLEP